MTAEGQLFYEGFEKMAESFSRCVTFPAETNERRQLEGVGHHMPDDSSDFYAPTLVHRGRNISRHVLVKTVADNTNGDRWKAILLRYR